MVKRAARGPSKEAGRPVKRAKAAAVGEIGIVNACPSQSGYCYVIGTGDCGQLGLGEDVTEKLRPGVVPLPDADQVCSAQLHAPQGTSDPAQGPSGMKKLVHRGFFCLWIIMSLVAHLLPMLMHEGIAPPKGTLAPLTKLCKRNMQALSIAAGGMHTLCLATNNNLYSWGVNDEAALGRNAGGEPWSKSKLADALEVSDEPRKVKMPESAGTIVAVTAGDSHSTALTSIGQILAWGTYRDDAGVMGFSETDKFSVRFVTLATIAARSCLIWAALGVELDSAAQSVCSPLGCPCLNACSRCNGTSFPCEQSDPFSLCSCCQSWCGRPLLRSTKYGRCPQAVTMSLRSVREARCSHGALASRASLAAWVRA